MIVFNPHIYELAALQINAGGIQIGNLSRDHEIEIHADMVIINVLELSIHERVELDGDDGGPGGGGADEAEKATG
ncbi:hypothetical protein T12_16556, partial [Trichinella patagoniensis]